MSILKTLLEGIGSVAIIGHVRPDGDCTSSCLGLYNYLKANYPQIKCKVYLEQPSEKFAYLSGFEEICSNPKEDCSYDLCVCLDAGDQFRFGPFIHYFESSKKSLCVDHHITNAGFAQENVIIDDASSTCEVLFGLLEEEKITKQVAECIYTGLVHDTGVFKYSCTSGKTMMIAGKMMEKGIDFTSIIDDSFYRKTYVQNQILGRALMESSILFDGQCIFSVIRQKDMEFYGVSSKDLDGIIDQMRVTEGVQCAVLLYETQNLEYKVSLRANNHLDVSQIASYFGGGGHIKAAGCTMCGTPHDVMNNLSIHIEKQLR